MPNLELTAPSGKPRRPIPVCQNRTGRGFRNLVGNDGANVLFDKRPLLFYPPTTCEKRILTSLSMKHPGIIVRDFWLVFLQVR